MPRTKPPFRADMVGSLLRPAALKDARARRAAGEITPDALRAVEDAEIDKILRKQEEIGLQSATDGELRRASWHMDFIYRLGGIRPTDEKLRVEFRNADETISFEAAALAVHDKISLPETIFADDFLALKARVTKATAKLTIPSPSMVHYRGGPAAIDPTVYPDVDELWHDLSAAYAEQVRSIAALGCEYRQLDDTSLAY